MEAFNSNGKSNIDFGQFKTISPVSTNPFSSVTVLTHGLTLLPNNTGVPDDFFKLADNIVSASSADSNDKGLILLYNKPTSLWVPVNSKGQELTDVTGGLNPGDTNYLSTLAHNIETNYVHQNKALVLLPEWSTGGESTQPETGFTEAAADAIFASIVGLDQALGGDVGEHDTSGKLVRLYDDKGDLIRTQGDIFNSPLHFIGFSRGTVVESEIIQRLGKFYPYAGGAINADGTPVLKDGKPVRDLQMTTIDPHDFAQESLKVDIPGTNLKLKDFTDFHDPKVEVWSHVTFADNYYQTVADPNGSTWTPNGRAIDGADVNVNLDGRTGFTWDDRKGGPHGNVLSWYAGTIDLGLDKVGNGYTQQARPIYNSLGEKGVQDLLNPKDNPVSLTPWYSTASSEGIDNGWFYSVLGGGEDLRPTVDLSQRVSVDFDNTDDSVAKGDFAIPTVFNGNFDVGSSDDPNAPVPGWSFHNGDGNQPLLNKYLVDKSTVLPLAKLQPIIDSDPQNNVITNDETSNVTAALSTEERVNSDNVLKFGGSGGIGIDKPLVHNEQLENDWGALGFDLFAPGSLGDSNGKLKVTLQDSANPANEVDQTIFLKELELTPQQTPVSYNYQDASTKLDFAPSGFETFNIQVPGNLQGKTIKIIFTLSDYNGDTFYVDNIGFQNVNLKFGNPSNARYADPNNGYTQKDLDNYRSNFLIERPQYALSYNSITNTANWASWEIDKNWIWPADGGYSLNNKRNFQPDTTLPDEFYKVQDNDYDNITFTENENKTTYAQGHLVPLADRDRNWKDNIAANQLSNIVPQTSVSNNGVWRGFESYVKRFILSGNVRNGIKLSNKEVYVVAGTYDTKDVELTAKGTPGTDPLSNQTSVKIPKFLWQVILVVNQPDLKPEQITKDNAYAIGFWMPNDIADNDKQGNRQSNWNQKDPITQNYTYIKSVNFIEAETGYDFFSYLPESVQAVIKANDKILNPDDIPDAASLLADESLDLENNEILTNSRTASSLISNTVVPNTSIWHNGITENSLVDVIKANGIPQIGISEIGVPKEGVFKNSTSDIGITEVSTSKSALVHLNPTQVGTNQGSIIEVGLTPYSPTQIGIGQVGSSQVSSFHSDSLEISPTQIGVGQVGTLQKSSFQNGSSQVSLTQVNISQIQINSTEINNSSKISFPIIIPSQQFLSIHTLTPESITTINNTAQTLWNTLLAPQTPFNINLQLTDSLAKGQLAEAIVTKYDSLGRPIGGTIEVDPTANGLGWFIDPNITDQGEFSQTLSSTANRATTNSDAYGHYDLLTALLHEMAHLAGFISGYSGFDSHVQIVNGSRLFVGDNFTAPLTPDGSHLDPKTYAYDLLNPTLTPGVRELPSQIDVDILKEVRSADNVVQNTITQASLTSAPLTDILNGKFDISDTTDPNYGWTTRGAATVISKEAVLTEDSPLNSEFKQTFTVPQGAKYLEFTLKDTTLGSDTADSPGDAFEVALLDANEKTSLVDTAVGLTRTDAFLNIQHDGHMYTGSNLIVPKTTTQSVPMTFKVDVSGIQAGTTATLYFDLLGFGNHDAKVTIDDVQLLNSDPVPPVANNDTATTDAGKQVTINVLANDTSNQTIDPTSIALATNPTQGTIAVNKDGTLAYTPNNNFVGTDTFTYTVANSDGTTRDPATVTVTVKDVAPTITDIPVPKKVYQLDPTNFSATATTTGDNHLTYTWDFGDGTNPTQGATVQHTFTTSGEYQITLQVVDAIGLKDTKTVTVYVGSTAPGSGDDPTLPPGFGDVAPQITDLPVPKKVYSLDPTNFSATATSPIGEPLTYTWNFGDGTDAVVGQSVSHTFVASGQYDATLTVTDDFGFSDTKTVTVYVGSTAPTNDGASLPDWNGTWDDIFRQFGNMS